MRIALFQPDIPQNSGAVIRLGACLGLGVDLIGPLGFLADDRRLRRSALDYAARAALEIWPDWARFAAHRTAPGRRLLAFEPRAGRPYWDLRFAADDVLLFGPETGHLPDDVLAAAAATAHIPLATGNRSLNLAMAAAMVAGEARRQIPLAAPSDPETAPSQTA